MAMNVRVGNLPLPVQAIHKINFAQRICQLQERTGTAGEEG